MFSKISSSFDNLFDYCKINPDGIKLDEHPLEEIKILFNDKILKSCSPEMINSYYNKLAKNEDITDDFKKIIQKTYGDKALDVLESRPSLNVHSINSLEVFDERIMNNFGEAFVHNCLTYNINDFQEFLEIIKDQEKLEVFKSYYDILCEVYGRNVETMQRSITEFSFNKELLQNVNGLDLSPSQVENLTNVLASEKNMLNINTLEELDDFNIKANEDLKTLLMWYKDSGIKGHDSVMFRTLITSNLFGMNYDSKTPYGETVRRLVSLYNFNDQEGYSSEEIKIMNILNFINKEANEDKIIEFI